MENGARTRSSRKRGLKEPVADMPAEEEKCSSIVSSPRSSSRKRRNPINDNNSGISACESAELASINDPVQPPGSVQENESSQESSGEVKNTYQSEKESRRHFTRSKKESSPEREKPTTVRIRRSSSYCRSEGEDEEEEEKKIAIDAYATILATLDERSYHRSLLSDADGMARGILLPMDLPWMHSVVPVARNIPCDIDDLAPALTADDGIYTPFENGPLGFGRFDVGQLRRGFPNPRLVNSMEMVCAASRRSEDPGVTELSTVTLPPNPPDETSMGTASLSPNTSLNSSEIPVRHQGCNDDDPFIRGELSLRCFEHTQRRKRRKVNQSRSCARKQYISVKVNSSSSRASLFSNLSSESARLLEATLPLEVQNGRFLSASNAQNIADKLGSYNWRHGLGATNPSGKNSNRISVGRTRLMWTEKSPSDQPQRVYFTSLLTGAKLESGTQKRPREIRVGVKVNGEFWNGEYKNPDQCPRSDSNKPKPAASESSLYSGKVRDGEISTGNYVIPRMQCALDSDQLVRSILKGLSGSKIDLYNEREPESTLLSKKPLIKSARIECVPDSNGIICVSCTLPGSISASSVHEPLNNAARQDRVFCTVCWSPREDGSAVVKECSECGVLVHLQCCRDTGEVYSIPYPHDTEGHVKWKCAVCCKMRVHKEGESIDSESGSETSKKRRRKSRPPPRMKDSHVEPLAPKQLDSSPNPSVADELKCVLCPYSGGAMSPAEKDGNLVWIHEVCRIWADGAKSPDRTLDTSGGLRYETCALCGAEDTGVSSSTKTSSSCSDQLSSCLIKCAAARCRVHFHPMCALLSSKLSEKNLQSHKIFKTDSSEENSLEKAKGEDSDLCTQFTLTALQCEGEEGAIGKDPGETRSLIVPAGFCGIHNPMREPSFYGMYPGGNYMDPKHLTVPSFKKSAVT